MVTTLEKNVQKLLLTIPDTDARHVSLRPGMHDIADVTSHV